MDGLDVDVDVVAPEVVSLCSPASRNNSSRTSVMVVLGKR